MNRSLFQHQLFIGYVSKVNANRVVVHIPTSLYLSMFFHYGEKFHGGIINSYILIEGESLGFIGKVTSTEIPEKERLEISTEALKHQDFHPLLYVEILSNFDYHDVVFRKSITDFPNIGSRVYMASNRFV